MKLVFGKALSVATAIAAVIFLFAFDILFEVNAPKVAYVPVSSSKISGGDDLKLVQISDVHGYPIASHKTMMGKISNFSPIAILLTGDVIDRSTTDFSGSYEDIKALLNIAPVIFVTGNHELANPEGRSFISGLSDIGVTVLRNDSVAIRDGFVIAGIEDIHFGRDDIEKTMGGITAESFNILLSHTPTISGRLSDDGIVDLVLSGHTHGGQVRLPFFGAVFLPDDKMDPRLIKGLTELENGVTVYTDSGFGTSVLPVRFMDRSQISFITISGK